MKKQNPGLPGCGGLKKFLQIKNIFLRLNIKLSCKILNK